MKYYHGFPGKICEGELFGHFAFSVNSDSYGLVGCFEEG